MAAPRQSRSRCVFAARAAASLLVLLLFTATCTAADPPHLTATPPAQVLEAAIQRMVQDAKSKALAKASAAAPPFLPAPAFQGRRRGYLFSTGRQGTG